MSKNSLIFIIGILSILVVGVFTYIIIKKNQNPGHMEQMTTETYSGTPLKKIHSMEELMQNPEYAKYEYHHQLNECVRFKDVMKQGYADVINEQDALQAFTKEYPGQKIWVENDGKSNVLVVDTFGGTGYFVRLYANKLDCIEEGEMIRNGAVSSHEGHYFQ